MKGHIIPPRKYVEDIGSYNGLNYLRGVEACEVQIEVFAHDLDDVVDGDFLLVELHVDLQNLLSQVYITPGRTVFQGISILPQNSNIVSWK